MDRQTATAPGELPPPRDWEALDIPEICLDSPREATLSQGWGMQTWQQRAGPLRGREQSKRGPTTAAFLSSRWKFLPELTLSKLIRL